MYERFKYLNKYKTNRSKLLVLHFCMPSSRFYVYLCDSISLAQHQKNLSVAPLLLLQVTTVNSPYGLPNNLAQSCPRVIRNSKGVNN